jgi:hypothetical protein
VFRSFRRVTVWGSVALGGVWLCGCATTTRLATVNGRPTYEIECGEVGECWTQASRTCRGSYQMLQRHDDWISESDLPGLNERTEVHLGRPETLRALATRTYVGVGSERPIPITNVVVMCIDG